MNPETFSPIPVEFIGGPLCGRCMTLPSNASSRYTHYESPLDSLDYKGSGYVSEVPPDQLVRHVYVRRTEGMLMGFPIVPMLENGNVPMDWVPPKAKA